MSSSRGENFSAEEIKNISRADIAKIFYVLVDENELTQIGKFFALLAERIKPVVLKRTVYMSKPEEIKPEADPTLEIYNNLRTALYDSAELANTHVNCEIAKRVVTQVLKDILDKVSLTNSSEKNRTEIYTIINKICVEPEKIRDLYNAGNDEKKVIRALFQFKELRNDVVEPVKKEIPPSNTPATIIPALPAFDVGILNLYFISLIRLFKKNEFQLDPAEHAESLQQLSNLFSNRQSEITSFENDIQTIEEDRVEENNLLSESALDGHEFNNIINDIFLAIQNQKQLHISLFEEYLENIQSRDLEDSIKAAVLLLRDLAREYEEQHSYEYSDQELDDEDATALTSSVDDAPKLLSNVETIQHLIATNKERNTLLRSMSIESIEESKEDANEGKKPLEKNTDFTDLLDAANDSILLNKKPLSLSVEMSSLVAHQVDKSYIIKRGLIEFAMRYIRTESTKARIIRMLLESTQQLMETRLDADLTAKKNLLEATDHFLEAFLPLSTLEEKLEIEAFIKTFTDMKQLEKEADIYIQKSIFNVRMYAMRIRNNYDVALPSAEMSQPELAQEKLAQTFIYAVTQVDMSDEDYELYFKNLFIAFIRGYSTCENKDAENMFNELLSLLPLAKLEKARHAAKLIAGNLDKIYSTAFDDDKKIHQIISDFTAEISAIDVSIDDAETKMQQAFAKFSYRCGFDITIQFDEDGSLEIISSPEEKERMKTVSATLDYLRHLEKQKKGRPELKALTESTLIAAKLSLQDLLALNLKHEDHQRQFKDIVNSLSTRTSLKSAVHLAPLAPQAVASYWWPWKMISYSLFGAPVQDNAEAAQEDLKEEQRNILKREFTSLKI